MEYKLIKSKRKSISISINKLTFEILVRAPKFLSKREIELFLISKKNWIDKVISTYKSENSNLTNEFLYLGKSYEIIKSNDYSSKLTLIDKLYVNSKVQDLQAEILHFYYKIGSDIIKNKIEELSEANNLKFNRLVFKNMHTRWGSCSSKKNININIRLLRAPIEIIDYVLIHELCHLNEMNHSKAFWDLVAEIDPKYKIHRKWLKENSIRLMRDIT